jgi:hypothetical protein
MNFKHPCYLLNTKTMPMSCWTSRILMSTSIPTLLEIFHPSLRNKGSKTMVTSFLLKTITNPTPYHVMKNKTTPLCTKHIHHSLWTCQKPPITLPHWNNPDATLKNWAYRTWLCRYGSHTFITFLFLSLRQFASLELPHKLPFAWSLWGKSCLHTPLVLRNK